jgi:uncharacterized protein (DUF302 family)
MKWKAIPSLSLLLLSIAGQSLLADDSGLITKPSKYSVANTVHRFEDAVQAKGQIVFGEVDHAAAAAKYGIKFAPHTTILFGRPDTGTPLLERAGSFTVDAPQKIAIWQDEQGKVWLTYNSAEYLAVRILPRHGLSLTPDQKTNLQRFLDQVTDQATQ